jgi:hypothetical protein
MKAHERQYRRACLWAAWNLSLFIVAIGYVVVGNTAAGVAYLLLGTYASTSTADRFRMAVLLQKEELRAMSTQHILSGNMYPPSPEMCPNCGYYPWDIRCCTHDKVSTNV